MFGRVSIGRLLCTSPPAGPKPSCRLAHPFGECRGGSRDCEVFPLLSVPVCFPSCPPLNYLLQTSLRDLLLSPFLSFVPKVFFERRRLGMGTVIISVYFASLLAGEPRPLRHAITSTRLPYTYQLYFSRPHRRTAHPRYCSYHREHFFFAHGMCMSDLASLLFSRDTGLINKTTSLRPSPRFG